MVVSSSVSTSCECCAHPLELGSTEAPAHPAPCSLTPRPYPCGLVSDQAGGEGALYVGQGALGRGQQSAEAGAGVQGDGVGRGGGRWSRVVGWGCAVSITPGSRLHAECTDVAVVCGKTGKSGEYTINCKWTLV